MKQTKIIEPSKFMPFYKSLTEENRELFMAKLNRKKKWIERYSITQENFDYLKQLFDANNSNTVGQPAEFDFWQMQKYFQGLTQLINSREDFQILPRKQIDAVIEEHKRIHKILLTYKN